eukprot:Gb_18516 [translate_table: standard]
MLGGDVRIHILRLVTKRGDPKMVQRLLDCGAQPLETDEEKRTALHLSVDAYCSNEGRLAIAKTLLEESGGNQELVRASNAKGRTALHIAALSGQPSMCGLLLRNGAILNAKDVSGQNPLHYAVKGEKGNVMEVIAVLIKREIIDTPVDSPSIVDSEDEKGNTPLDIATARKEREVRICVSQHLRGYYDLAKKLLEKGANLLESDGDGKSAIHYAAEGGNEQVADYIFYKTDKKEDLANVLDKNGRTALHVSAFPGHALLCEILLPLNRRLYMCIDRDGQTPLHYAVKGNHEAVVNTLLGSSSQKGKYGVDFRDLRGETPLHIVAAQGNLTLVEKLLSVVEDPKQYVRIGDFLGETALHKAARIGHRQIVEKLLQSGSRPLQERDSGIGTAEESLTRKELAADDPIKIFLEEEKGKTKKDCNLVRTAASLGYIDMTQELLTRNGDIADLRNPTWKRGLSKKEQENVDRVVNQIDKITEQASEQPTLSDDLERNDFAIGLGALFLSPYVKSPIAVGISGEWGMGKSSLMIQTEIILLRTAAQLAFPNLLEVYEKFPGSKDLTKEDQKKSLKIRRSLEALLLAADQESKWMRRIIGKIGRSVAHLFGIEPKTEPEILFHYLEKYDLKYHAVYKSLAIMERSDMIERDSEKSVSNNKGIAQETVPAILIVRYNAWEYRNESEAWAGLAVEITREMEETMTLAQWLSTCWRKHRRSIWVAMILPFLLVVILASCVTWFVWSKQKGLKEIKYGSLPATLLVIVCTVVMAVLKPVSTQIAEWDWSPNNVKDTAIPKMPPQFKGNLRIIVFVDDLDRCQESVILQVLTAINLVLAVCKIDVIIGMDKKMINRAIIKKYGEKGNNKSKKHNEELAEIFFQKIIQLPLNLPDPSDTESKKFLEGQISSLDGVGGEEENISRAEIDSVKERKHSSTAGSVIAAGSGETTINVSENENEASGERKLKPVMGREMFFSKYSYGERNIFLLPTDIDNKYTKTSSGMEAHAELPSAGVEHFFQIQESKVFSRMAGAINCMDICLLGMEGTNQSTYTGITTEAGMNFCLRCLKSWHKFDVLRNWTDASENPSLRVIVDRYIEEKQRSPEKLYPAKGEEKDETVDVEREDDKERKQQGKRKGWKQAADEEELEDWKRLRDTLRRYDVSMDGIQAFQKFRFYCIAGYLRWPIPNTQLAIEWALPRQRSIK